MRLRQLRTDLGLTTDELAAFARMTPQRLVALEGGEMPSVAEAGRIADALALDERALWSDSGHRVVPLARFRGEPGLDGLPAVDVRTLLRILQLMTELAALQRALNPGHAPWAALRNVTPLRAGRPHDQGYDLARATRAAMGLQPNEAVESMGALLADAGICVIDVVLANQRIEAISMVVPDAVPCVVVNAGITKTADALLRRAVLAHEFCHVLHDAGEDARTLQPTWQDDYNDDIEKRAEAFGAELLAPADAVLRLPQALGDLALVRRVMASFGVSATSAKWRLVRAGRLPQGIAERDGFEARVDSSTPTRFGNDARPADDMRTSLLQGRGRTLVARAFDEGLISSGRRHELERWS